jgi:hypothetical protein
MSHAPKLNCLSGKSTETALHSVAKHTENVYSTRRMCYEHSVILKEHFTKYLPVSGLGVEPIVCRWTSLMLCGRITEDIQRNSISNGVEPIVCRWTSLMLCGRITEDTQWNSISKICHSWCEACEWT